MLRTCVCYKQVYWAGISNYNPQYYMGCNYLSMPFLAERTFFFNSCILRKMSAKCELLWRYHSVKQHWRYWRVTSMIFTETGTINLGDGQLNLHTHLSGWDNRWPEKLLWGPGGRFKNTSELLNLRALKFSLVNKIHIFQCMGKIFCVEFRRFPLKFHTKYFTHTLKDMIFIQHWNFKSS